MRIYFFSRHLGQNLYYNDSCCSLLKSLALTFLFVLSACFETGGPDLESAEEDNNQQTKNSQSRHSSLYEGTYRSKLTELKEGSLKVESALQVLCGTGEVLCDQGEKAACYGRFGGDFATLGLDFESFGRVFENSLPVCLKDNVVSNTHPSCQNETLPICGINNVVLDQIGEGQVICPGIGVDGVVCPFGGRPFCVIDKKNEKKAYCINNSHIIFSTSDQYNQSYNISCSDGVSRPHCISFLSRPGDMQKNTTP